MDIEAQRAHNVGVVRRLIDAQSRRDAEAFLATVTDDIVIAYPLKPPGHPERIEGKARFAAYLAEIADGLPALEVSGLEIHAGADPDYVVAEFRLAGGSPQTGRVYDSNYMTSARFREGLIREYRMFYDPISLLRAFGDENDLKEALRV